MDQKPTKAFAQKQQKKLEEERARISAQILELKRDDPFADPEHASDNAAIDTDVREQIGHETIEAEIMDLQKRLKDMEVALSKIERGEYGYCERCHMPIPQPRIELVPEARYCITCEKALVR